MGLKLNASGNVTWQRTYGDSGCDDGTASRRPRTAATSWREYSSFGAGSHDLWVLKLDTSGNVTWQRTYGGTGDDDASAVQETSDGGYIVAGYTLSFGAGNGDIWVLKLDASGNVTWQRPYRGTGFDGPPPFRRPRTAATSWRVILNPSAQAMMTYWSLARRKRASAAVHQLELPMPWLPRRTRLSTLRH